MNIFKQHTALFATFAGAAALVAAPAIADQHMESGHDMHAEMHPDPIEVEVMTSEGRSAGTVTFEQMDHGVMITANLRNLPQGAHGFHIHETGACSPDFGAAGSHYNPLGVEHGFDSSKGYHAGDLPNVHVGADGTAIAQVIAPHLTLHEKGSHDHPFTLRDEDGSAVMIHAEGDDYSDMSSSGGRMACGVIVPAGE